MMDTILRTLAICAAVVLFFAFWGQDALRNWECAQNLERVGAALKTYASQNDSGRFAPLSPTPGRLMFPAESIGPKAVYLASSMISNANPERAEMEERAESFAQSAFDDKSYWYVGYAFANEKSAKAWLDAYKQTVPLGAPVPDFQTTMRRNSNYERRCRLAETLRRSLGMWPGFRPNSDVMYAHLSEGIGTTLAPEEEVFADRDEVDERIPVLIERPELHGNGGHVLFMDGHVEFMPYPGPFPMTKEFIEGLRSLDRLEFEPPNQAGRSLY